MGSHNHDFGHFSGPVVAQWLPGWGMLLSEPLTFTDTRGAEYTAPRSLLLDGASIPRFLWGIVGCPFTGEYRTASVVHDHMCVVKRNDWRFTHYLFWQMCRACGVGRVKSWILWAGVRFFGPRW